MAATTVPISASVLNWAREEAGLTEADLAERVNLPVADIQAWEAGAALPTQSQFSKLVKTLRRPSAVFFLPEPPVAAGMPTSLRRATSLQGHKIGPDEARQIRWARRLQGLVSWILRDQSRAPVTISQYSLDMPPARAAGIERERSAVRIDQQTSWKSASAAFRAWRRHLEEQDVLVLQLSMGRGNIRGFGAWDDHAPLVAVNTAYHPTARIYTLFHEFGHLLTRSDSACQDFVMPGRHDGNVERWCERFAAAFLLPEEALRAMAARYDVTPTSPTTDPDKARLIAGCFSVSIRATAIRLQEFGLAEPALHSRVVSQFAGQDWSDSSGGGQSGGSPAYEQRIRQLGTRLPNILLSAADRGQLTTRDLADLLNLTTGSLGDMRGLLLESG
ncbi:MAG: ImmA/IrrE family metallo-endopeptidase [Acidimicrobiaceae bacterium]|nr:ImmA/IrrE family metallo-endopeptidase [Acidimicrobiaceae bacterium]MCY4175231.1 ImmA/IrrE family metallo-endopeptidase [Acidimicrobiaceae bacterium]MCY4279276.1 ImmA/IrrE family metallo-endopeptidase [Acidimicrobiaceae bacterium]MCY4294654.1 ImmA/IrrE family metallo-endopeptidase [Acidimicrobiaceae bacterium]